LEICYILASDLNPIAKRQSRQDRLLLAIGKAANDHFVMLYSATTTRALERERWRNCAHLIGGAFCCGRILNATRCLSCLLACLAFAATLSASDVVYGYDSSGRVTSATYDDGTVVSYTYDAASNLLGASTTLAASSIVTQPQSQVVNEGASVSFTVVATGSGPLSYQWTFNSVDISGATGPTFTLDNVMDANSGSYAVRVSNGVNSVTSAAVTLTVNSGSDVPTMPVWSLIALATLLLLLGSTHLHKSYGRNGIR
jgi:YD repeat-containing protein